MPTCQGHALAARVAARFARREAIRWGLVLPGVPHIIGTCGYTRWDRDNHYAVLGYDLARPYWRQGLMTEAVAAVVRLGFEQMDLHRVEATVIAGNAASAALLSRAGFGREGVLRERVLNRGVFRDVQKPTYDEGVISQVEAAVAKQGPGDLDGLYNDGDTWEVQ